MSLKTASNLSNVSLEKKLLSIPLAAKSLAGR
jgi:hypothetical protein